jgi:hypothetical protein
LMLVVALALVLVLAECTTTATSAITSLTATISPQHYEYPHMASPQVCTPLRPLCRLPAVQRCRRLSHPAAPVAQWYPGPARPRRSAEVGTYQCQR